MRELTFLAVGIVIGCIITNSKWRTREALAKVPEPHTYTPGGNSC